MRMLHAIVLLLCLVSAGSPGAAAESGPLKTVDGEISSFSTSPDGSRVALIVTRKREDVYDTWLVLYDAGNERSVCTVPGDFYQPGTWSADSRWLALIEERHTIVCVDRKGTIKKFKPKAECGTLLWDPESRDTLLYCGPWDSKAVNSLSMDNGKERTVARGREIIGLYAMKGKAYYADVIAMPGTCYKEGLQTCELKSGKKSLLIPLYGRGYDVCSLTLSPDGRYYFFNGTLSAGSLNVLARVEDAPLICRKPYISILYQRAVEDDYCILWPRTRNLTGYEDDAVIQPHSEPSYFLDLASGSRRSIAWESYSLSDGLFFISPEGFKMLNESGETVLLIGHRPWSR
ncbi:MAG: hypothetical protein AB9903_36520 [Vulcanimicrobiota bacterium]